MQLLRQFFQPQRMDAVVLIVGTLVGLVSIAMALLETDRGPVMQLTMLLLAAIFYAVGAAAGCQQISIGRAGLLLFAAFIASVIAFVLLEKGLILSLTRSSALGRLPVLGLVSFVAHWLLRMAADYLAPRVASVQQDGQRRIRGLIGLALLMFVLHQIIQVSSMQLSPVTFFALGLVLLLMSYWLSITLTGAWSWLKVCLCIFSTIVVLLAVVVSKPSWSGLLVFTIPVALGMLAVGSGQSRTASAAAEQPTRKEGTGLPLPHI